jgi:hypothetical protein
MTFHQGDEETPWWRSSIVDGVKVTERESSGNGLLKWLAAIAWLQYRDLENAW